MNLATETRKPERQKGTEATERPAAGGARQRAPQTVRLRRLHRLHRAARELWEKRGPSAALTPEQCKHWEAALRDELAPEIPTEQGGAAEVLTAAVVKEERVQPQARQKLWRARFATWCNDVVKAAKPVLHQGEAAPIVAVEEARQQWQQYWERPALECHAAGWRQQAAAAGWDPEPSQEYTHPSVGNLRDAVKHVHGAAGLDGWTSQELREMPV